jgi:hypothetical protein
MTKSVTGNSCNCRPTSASEVAAAAADSPASVGTRTTDLHSLRASANQSSWNARRGWSDPLTVRSRTRRRASESSASFASPETRAARPRSVRRLGSSGTADRQACYRSGSRRSGSRAEDESTASLGMGTVTRPPGARRTRLWPHRDPAPGSREATAGDGSAPEPAVLIRLRRQPRREMCAPQHLGSNSGVAQRLRSCVAYCDRGLIRANHVQYVVGSKERDNERSRRRAGERACPRDRVRQ